MAAPPDLINDPPSLICRYKDRRQAPISFSFSLLFLPSSRSPRTATKSPSMERAGEVESKRLFRSWSEQTRERASSTLVPSPSYCSKALRPLSFSCFSTLLPFFAPGRRMRNHRSTNCKVQALLKFEPPTPLFRHRSLYIMNNHLVPKNSRYSYIFAFDDKKVTFFPNRFLFIWERFIWVYMEIFSTTNMYKWK